MESNRLTHIDSPDDNENLTSDETEPFHGESLLDDISSVLGHDFFGAIQDHTITEDTTTLCGGDPPKPKRKISLKQRATKIVQKLSESSGKHEDNAKKHSENVQFGFENMLFEMDNRCDDQKVREPIRYCSLAKFIDGNDIARKSFKVRKKAKQTIITPTILRFFHFCVELYLNLFS